MIKILICSSDAMLVLRVSQAFVLCLFHSKMHCIHAYHLGAITDDESMGGLWSQIRRWRNSDQVHEIKMMVDHDLKMKLTN
jgi:hypothetical protein